jgi:hypothetical protein
LEYWQWERRSLHVSGNDGEITDFNDMKDYEIISDEANLLNHYEVVKCKTHKYEDRAFGLKYGKAEKPAGRINSDRMLMEAEKWMWEAKVRFYSNLENSRRVRLSENIGNGGAD